MRDSGPVRKDVTSDTDAAVPTEYIGVARTLLGQLKGRMEAGGLAQLTRSVNLPDGTSITVASIHGQDTIRVYRPEAVAPGAAQEAPPQPEIEAPAPEELPPRPTQFICTPGPDSAVFSTALDCYNTQYYPAVMSPQRDVVFVGGGLPGPTQWFNNGIPPDAVTNASQLYRLDPKTLKLLGQQLLDYPNNANNVGGRAGIAADKTRSAFMGTYGVVRIPVLNLPDESDFAPTTSVWNKSGTPVEIETPSTSYASQLISAGTTYGSVLAIRSITPDGGPDNFSTVTLDPVTGAIISTLAWPANADLISGFLQWGSAQSDGNFLIAFNDAVYLVDPGGNKLKSFGTPPGDSVTGCMQAGAAWVQTSSGLYRSNTGGWKQMLTWASDNTLLTFDHYTDAVVMVKPDGSVAAIFGGYDCAQQPMGINTVQLKQPPSSYTQLTVSQCENGTLLVTFGDGTPGGPISGVPDTPATVVVGRYDLGILRQVRTTLYE